MTDDQLLRYARHIMLDAVGIEGQQRFLDSRALVIGAGGLGSPVALYLAGAGVGHLTIVDADVVDLSNLQRQIGHDVHSLGQPKAESLRQRIHALNPGVNVHTLLERVDAEALHTLVGQADVVLDCSDNFATRQAVNAACVRHGVPLVSGAAIGFDGQLAVFDPRLTASPCYACVFPADSQVADVACATLGVLAPLVGVIGSLQAVQALKLLGGMGECSAGTLSMLDALSMEWSTLRAPRNPACSVCGGR